MTAIKIVKNKINISDNNQSTDANTNEETGSMNSSSDKENVSIYPIHDDKKLKINERLFEDTKPSSVNRYKENPKNVKVPTELNLDAELTMKDISNTQLPSSLVRGRPSSCVFVASLCSNKTDDELGNAVTEHFEKWGNLSTVKVLRDTCNRPYAFVQYNNDQDSKRAIKFGHNSALHGRAIRCEPAKVNRTLFLSSKDTFTVEEIKTFLEDFGEVEQLAECDKDGVLHDPNSSESDSDSWYCMFVYRDDAIRAFANLSEDNSFEVEWAQNIEKWYMDGPKEPEDQIARRYDKFSVFVGQLNTRISESELKERFSLHGSVAQVDLIKRPNNAFAFVKYAEESGAASAVERENHSMLCGKTMHVQYREIFINNKGLERSKGIALAPPPINLTKRNSINKQNPFTKFENQKFNLKKSFQKLKFPGNPSNTYNRRRPLFQFYQPKENIHKLETNDKVEKVKHKNLEISHENPESPPQSGRTNDSISEGKFSGSLTSSEISPKSSHKLKRNSKFEGAGYKYSTPSSNSNLYTSGNSPHYPYYYYFPTDVPSMPGSMAGKFHPVSSSGLPPPPPSSYFYQQYFMPPIEGTPLSHFPPAPYPHFFQPNEPGFSL